MKMSEPVCWKTLKETSGFHSELCKALRITLLLAILLNSKTNLSSVLYQRVSLVFADKT